MTIGLLGIYVLLLFKTAWLGDDAYITFRTIDNFVNGFGLRWNIAERVQSYTHPLWLFLLSSVYFFTREIFFTSLATSIVISILAVYIISFKLSKTSYNTIIVLLLIIFSKAFLDYSTSGLENPLTNLLLVLFGYVYLKKQQSHYKIFLLSILSSFIMTNRMDCGLLVLPALFSELFKSKKLSPYFYVLLGFTPFIIWELFSLLYYGFPFPNTAYAKLNTGISRFDLIEQGFKYFISSFKLDPITLIIIFITIVISVIRHSKEHLALIISIVLYLVYIVWIGGDFMSGRFFVAPFILSLIILSNIKIASTRFLIFSLPSIFIIGILSPAPTVLGDSGIRERPLIDENGICDERMFYYANTSLILAIKNRNYPNFYWVEDGLDLKNKGLKFVRAGNVGFLGYYIGSKCYIMDELALCDPLLSRLPTSNIKYWRIGHFRRNIPAGYEKSIKLNINCIEEPNLSEYYDKLQLIINGNIWDFERLLTIWEMNMGQYNYLLSNYNKLQKNKNSSQNF
jgi:arabinofuranosyltransferase